MRATWRERDYALSGLVAEGKRQLVLIELLPKSRLSKTQARSGRKRGDVMRDSLCRRHVLALYATCRSETDHWGEYLDRPNRYFVFLTLPNLTVSIRTFRTIQSQLSGNCRIRSAIDYFFARKALPSIPCPNSTAQRIPIQPIPFHSVTPSPFLLPEFLPTLFLVLS